jgi:Lon protease-like protein
MAEIEELGVFPLEMVMLPGEAVPLHLFEPRYRELFANCVLDGKPLVILLSSGGSRASVGCTGQIETMLKRLPDGRVNVVLRGMDPVRITDAPTIGGPLYETAVVEPLTDESEAAPDDIKQQARELFSSLAGSEQVPEPPPGIPLSYALAGIIEMPVEPKQELLELRREQARLERVIELLKGADHASELEREAAARAQRNGKVNAPS